MKRWSKLQKELYKLLDDTINLQLHCVAYPMKSRYGSTSLPRYYITLDKEIIWDYPKDFVLKDGTVGNYNGEHKGYPYNTDVPDISSIIREYIDTSKVELYSKHFESDKWGLTNILKATDRRIGKRRLEDLKKKIKNQKAHIIINKRLEKQK